MKQTVPFSDSYFSVEHFLSLLQHEGLSDEFLAEQIVNMSNEYEIFNTEHIVHDRKAYLSGINLVLDSLEDLAGYYFGLESILKNRFKI